MRALAVLLTLAGFVLPAYGAKQVTVDRLEQTLAAAHGLPDAEVAMQLSDLELTERLSTAKLDRLETDLPGEKSRQALMIPADASAFLDPPAAEIPSQSPPDLTTQQKTLALTVNYVTQTLHQLPNFYATRVTRSFEDTPAVKLDIGAGDINPNAAYQPIHLVGDSKVTVSFRDGHEVLEKTKLDPLVRNLDTAGVFGPILGTVLVDAARSKLAWSHWEQGPSGLQAVFSYEVPKEKSHYTITYDSVPIDPAPCNITKQTFSKVVAYHGEMAVDRASGTILRLILLADLKPDEFAPSRSGIEVEYGQVSIGGKPYFLPIKSVTSSLGHYLFIRGAGGVESCSWLAVTRAFQTSLNDVVFENYHVFRTDARVLTESEAANFEHQPAPAPNGNGSKQTEEASSSPVAAAPPGPSPAQSSSQAASSTRAAANLANLPAPESQPAPQPAQSIAESAPPPAAASLPASSQPPQPAPANSANPDIPDVPVFRTSARPGSGRCGGQQTKRRSCPRPSAIRFLDRRRRQASHHRLFRGTLRKRIRARRAARDAPDAARSRDQRLHGRAVGRALRLPSRLPQHRAPGPGLRPRTGALVPAQDGFGDPGCRLFARLQSASSAGIHLRCRRAARRRQPQGSQARRHG